MTHLIPRAPIRLTTVALLAAYATAGEHSPLPAAPPATTPAQVMDRFLDSLVGRMTLEEKLGQLSQPGAPDNHTGPAATAATDAEIRAGRIGSLLGANGAAATRRLQEIAVKESRLGIPLLFAYDVIHGFRTIFPVPLAEASSWDPVTVERSAHIAAVEATAHESIGPTRRWWTSRGIRAGDAWSRDRERIHISAA